MWQCTAVPEECLQALQSTRAAATSRQRGAECRTACVLRARREGRLHLKWTRFEQMHMQCVQLSVAIQQLLKLQLEADGAGVALLLGDFNSEPTIRALPTTTGWSSAEDRQMSPVYELAARGCVQVGYEAMVQAATHTALVPGELINQNAGSWQAISAYKTMLGEELSASNHDSDGPCTLDYIFVQSAARDRLDVAAVKHLCGWDCAEALPNSDFPSDHFWVSAQLQPSI